MPKAVRVLTLVYQAPRGPIDTSGWDDPLPAEFEADWTNLIATLRSLNNIKIPRCLVPSHFGLDLKYQLYAFADASEQAIAYVIYLRTEAPKKEVKVSFVCGGSLLIPKGTYYKGQLSIPRAELCAAVECTKAATQVESELDLELELEACLQIVVAL